MNTVQKISDGELEPLLVPRFLNYVRCWTESDRHIEETPSSLGQWDLARMLQNELLELGRTETDTNARYAIYREAQQIIMQDLPLIPLWQAAELHATTNNVSGFTVTPSGSLPLWLVSVTG